MKGGWLKHTHWLGNPPEQGVSVHPLVPKPLGETSIFPVALPTWLQSQRKETAEGSARPAPIGMVVASGGRRFRIPKEEESH